MRTLALLATVLLNFALFVPRLPHYGVIANDDEIILPFPMASVDIAVLDNDYDPSRDGGLSVVSASVRSGGAATVIDGTTVRVYLDWTAASDDEPGALVARGSYTASNGLGKDEATWTVWYWPEMTI